MATPEYTNKEYWDEITRQYIQNPNKFFASFNFYIERYLWEYFKNCLTRHNRYFFQHPLIPLLEVIFSEHTITLNENTEIYRARIDDGYRLFNEWQDYFRIKDKPEEIKKIESHKGHNINIMEIQKDYEATISSEQFKQMAERIESGFQGYDAKGSTAPPSGSATAGRCNPKGVSYLYAALEEHTAVAEIRPHIKDSISIATLKPSRDLRLIDFDYDPTAVIEGKNFLFYNIQQEFSQINKNQNGDYLVTQYITSLINHLGYDGLCFRSSLVYDGTNYVIFNPADCDVVSSKLCYLSKVVYDYGQCK